MFINWIGASPPMIMADAPIGIAHINSEFCWCDPIVESDEDGRETIVHHEVTWH
jgi:hypothetical protein